MPKTLSPNERGARSGYSVHNPAANTAATRTVTPVPGQRAWVDWILPSWSAAPDHSPGDGLGDAVTVDINGVEKYRWRAGVVDSVQGPQLMGPWYGEIDEVIVVTVEKPDAATASLSIKYREKATIT